MYANVEVAQTAREDVERAIRTVLGWLASRARTTLGDEFLDGVYRGLLATHAPDEVLIEALARRAAADAGRDRVQGVARQFGANHRRGAGTE